MNFLDDAPLRKMLPLKKYLIPCKKCGEICERNNKWVEVTCFDCKKESKKLTYQKQKEKRKKLDTKNKG